jgi:anti-anti-sigma factor
MDDPTFRVHTRADDDGDGLTIAIAGELDIAGAGDLDAAIRVARRSGRALTIDLSDLAFIDSSGLRVFLALQNAAVVEGFTYALIPGPPQVHRAFALCGLVETLPFAA